MVVILPSVDNDNEMIEVDLRDCSFKIKVLSKGYQHICKLTGLMLWESTRLMAAVLERNPTIVAEKRVLELWCGCGGICPMVNVESACPCSSDRWRGGSYQSFDPKCHLKP